MIWSKDTFTYPSKNRYRNTFEYMFILSKNSPKTFNPIIDKKNKWANTKVHGTSRNKKGDTFVKSNNNKTNVLDYGVRFNIWNNPTEKNSSMIKHPAMFPEKLVEDHILSWSNENDLVYDCFGGSGTTAKMAHKWKRNWILSEISKEYVEMAEKRIAPYLAQTFLF
jgi:site-specific DNA-methyltransferase (adenine-specific)